MCDLASWSIIAAHPPRPSQAEGLEPVPGRRPFKMRQIEPRKTLEQVSQQLAGPLRLGDKQQAKRPQGNPSEAPSSMITLPFIIHI